MDVRNSLGGISNGVKVAPTRFARTPNKEKMFETNYSVFCCAFHPSDISSSLSGGRESGRRGEDKVGAGKQWRY
jgi:hypothetical protein